MRLSTLKIDSAYTEILHQERTADYRHIYTGSQSCRGISLGEELMRKEKDVKIEASLGSSIFRGHHAKENA